MLLFQIPNNFVFRFMFSYSWILIVLGSMFIFFLLKFVLDYLRFTLMKSEFLKLS